MSDPIIIKKYSNRRLYHTKLSRYVTLDDLANMVRSDEKFVVRDVATGDDITHTILAQILLEKEKSESNDMSEALLPVEFLRHMIKLYGTGMKYFVPHYLNMSIEQLMQRQEEILSQMAQYADTATPRTPFAQNNPFAQNMQQGQDLFEKALNTMMTGPAAFFQQNPLHPPPETAKPPPQSSDPTTTENNDTASAKPTRNELDLLRRQINELNEKISAMTAADD